MSATFTSAYSRTHTAKYISDKMRNVLKYLISYYNLSPVALLDAWTDWVDAGARDLLERGDLEKIVIEFYKPGSDDASGRWDFPIRYDGNGVDEMWVDREFLEGSFAKTSTPPAGCIYRVLLCSSSGNLRLIRRFEKRGSGSSGLEFKRPAVGAASDGLRW